jgi:NADH:ubiquinone oxidoreductase subunit F (NADH-binding)
MTIEPTKLLTKLYGVPESWTLSVYEKAGGYQSARKALGMEPAKIIDEMKAANIRGRGGAGFPHGREVVVHEAAPDEARVPRDQRGRG